MLQHPSNLWSSEAQEDFFRAVLLAISGKEFDTFRYEMVAGGSFSNSVKIVSEGLAPLFLKFAAHEDADFFKHEAEGLETLLDALEETEISIPEVLGSGRNEGISWLALSFQESAYPLDISWTKLGEGLRHLHQQSGKGKSQNHFGFGKDKYIATIPQENEWCISWPEFYGRKRIMPLAGEAFMRGIISLELLKKIETLVEKLPELLGRIKKPSLIHGDLWNGNVLFGSNYKPILIDPSIYWADGEVDIAMAQLFGGFDRRFFDAYYQGETPNKTALQLYRLYPYLVHLLLFGSGYLSGVEVIVNRYVS